MKMQRFLALVLALAVMGLVACGGSGGSGSSGGGSGDGGQGESKAKANAINFGAVLPLTGASATIGEDQRRGIELAVQEINKAGGVNGKDINVVVEDSEGTARGAIDAARKLVNVDKVPVVVGEYSSGNTIPMGQFLQREGVVNINPGSSSTDVRGIGDYQFSTIGLDDVAGRFTAETIYEEGYRKAAFLAPNNAYGSGVLEETQARFEELGGQVAESVLYTEGQPDYRQELQRLSASDPDLYVYTAYGQEAATINRQAYQLGLSKTPFFGIYLSMCTTDSDPQAVEGQLGMEVNYVGPNGKFYEDAYKQKYGEDFASSFSGYTYDAVKLTVAAMKKAGGTDPKAIRDALPKVDDGYEGATGKIVFDEDGQRAEQPYIVVTYRNGEIVEPA